MDFKNEVEIILNEKGDDKLWKLLRLLKKLPDEISTLIENTTESSSFKVKKESIEYVNSEIQSILSVIEALNSKLPEIRSEVDLAKDEIYKVIEANKAKDGYTPIKGVDYFDGKDGSPDSPLEIAEKLNTTKESVEIS